MSNYPQLLVDRNEYLERVNGNLLDHAKMQEEEIERLRKELNFLHEAMDKSEDNRVWRWQGDGYDLTRSMANDLPVLIRADELRHVLEHGECIAEDAA